MPGRVQLFGSNTSDPNILNKKSINDKCQILLIAYIQNSKLSHSDNPLPQTSKFIFSLSQCIKH